MKHAVPPDFTASVDAVLVGASAGGIDALLALLQGVQLGRRVPVIVVLHLPAAHDSRLAEIFASRLEVPAREAEAHAPVDGGTLYFAPPGYHVLLEADRTFSLSCDAPVHFSRPSIDVLFESGAQAHGPRVAAIVLTGANEDGAAGLRRIRQCGGLTVVQDPAEAAYPAMPRAAIEAADPDFVLGLGAIRTLLQRLLLP
jgi:two-component system chemotaxis response regulator CheB